MRLLLALATTKASTLCGSTSTSTTAAATSTTAATASTATVAASTTPIAATEAPTPATTPTSTATPSASSTASTATPTVPSTTLAPLAPAVAAPPTRSRRSPDLLSANECTRLWSGVAGAGDFAAGDPGAGGAAGAGGTGGAAATGPGGARTRDTGVAGTGARGTGAGGAGAGGAGAGDTGAVGAGAGGTGTGGAGAGGAGVGDTGAVDPEAGGASAGGAVSSGTGAGDTVRPRPYFVPLLRQTLLQSVVSLSLVLPRLFALFALVVGFLVRVVLLSLAPTLWHFDLPLFYCVFLCLLLLSPLFLPSLTLSLTSLVLPVPLSLVSSPLLSLTLLFLSTAASAPVAELVDFAAACRLDYATALVAESESASPPSVGGECAFGTDVLEDRQEDFECLAAAVPRFASMLLAPEGDPDAPNIRPRALMQRRLRVLTPLTGRQPWMPRWHPRSLQAPTVKRPPGSPPAFKGRYAARGFSQQQGVDYFHTFSPTPKMTTLRVLLHVAAQRDYELHSLDFSTTFLQGSLHEEIWLRRPPGLTGSFPAGTQWSLWRPVYGLRLAPREWHDTLRTTLAALGFTPSTADPSLFLRTDTSLPPFYVLVYVLLRFGFQFSSPQPTPLSIDHSLSAPSLDDSVEPSGLYPDLVGCLITSGMGLVLGGRGPVVLTGHADASWVDDLATQRSSQGYTFSLGSGSISWRSTRSSSVLSSSCEAEIYAGAMAAQELR
ncbi:unnamed protein product [Closterium sp. NIES-53]